MLNAGLAQHADKGVAVPTARAEAAPWPQRAQCSVVVVTEDALESAKLAFDMRRQPHSGADL